MKALKIIGIILLILIVIAAALVAYVRYRVNHPKDNHDLEASLDKQAHRLFTNGDSCALVIGVYKSGRSFTKGYGTVQVGEKIVPDGSSVFELASTGKLFTTAMLQILCDRGVVHPDDKIADLLRDKITLPPSAANTTLRHLATHTSGFPSLPQSFIEKMKDENDPYKDLQTQDIYDYLKTCADKQPEGNFEYSNFGMGLLGHILAMKAGSNYEQAVLKELIQPLGMSNTFITIDSSNKGSIVQGYNEAGQPNSVWTDTVLAGAGSFLSTASDMLLFIRANVDKTHPLHNTLAKTQAQQFDGKTGLGWILPDGYDKFAGNKTVLWHNGRAGGYASYIAIDPVSGNGIIVLCNKSIDITGSGNMLMRIVNTQSWR